MFICVYLMYIPKRKVKIVLGLSSVETVKLFLSVFRYLTRIVPWDKIFFLVWRETLQLHSIPTRHNVPVQWQCHSIDTLWERKKIIWRTLFSPEPFSNRDKTNNLFLLAIFIVESGGWALILCQNVHRT